MFSDVLNSLEGKVKQGAERVFTSPLVQMLTLQGLAPGINNLPQRESLLDYVPLAPQRKEQLQRLAGISGDVLLAMGAPGEIPIKRIPVGLSGKLAKEIKTAEKNIPVPQTLQEAIAGKQVQVPKAEGKEITTTIGELKKMIEDLYVGKEESALLKMLKEYQKNPERGSIEWPGKRLPKYMYHTGTTPLSEFQDFATGERIGVHLGTKQAGIDRVIPKARSVGKELTAYVHKVGLDVQKPYMPEGKILDESIVRDGDKLLAIFSDPKEVTKLKNQGYDGVFYYNKFEHPGSLSVVVFDKAKAKILSIERVKVPANALPGWKKHSALYERLMMLASKKGLLG